MPNYRVAARIRQGNLVIYATSLTVRELRQPDFFKTDVLDPGEGRGYQRLLVEARAKQLAEYLVDGNKYHEAFLPTSVFLATDQDLNFDEEKNLLEIDHERAGSFNVVDGQHRIRGLLLGAEKDKDLDNFEVPVNIAVKLDTISQMTHFLIVNTTQRPVDKAIEQQIVARLTQQVSFEQTPVLPRWIRRKVDKGEDHRALRIAQHLNTSEGSPWYQKIVMANDGSRAAISTVNQNSFVTSLKKYILTPSNPISNDGWEIDAQKKALSNYWAAIRRLLVEPGDSKSIVFKTNGLNLFHSASPSIFLHLANRQDFKTSTIEGLLRQTFENLPPEHIAMSTAAFWKRGGLASGMNKSAIGKCAAALARAVNVQPSGGPVEL